MRRILILCAIAATMTVLPSAASFQSVLLRTNKSPSSTRHHDHGRIGRVRIGALLESSSIDMLGALDSFYRNSPYEAAFVTCGVKAASSDAIAQRAVEKVDVFGFRRNASFIAYGGLYQGVAQYVIFNQLYPIMFGQGTDFVTVAEKVLFDQIVLTPFLCLPIAYIVKAAVFGFSVKEALSRYIQDAKKDLLWKYWAIWTPTQCITFSIVPEHLRIPFIAAISFVWLIILSNISSRNDAVDETTSMDGATSMVICYDNECLIMDTLSFAGPASLINEDASDAGVRLGPEIEDVKTPDL